MGCRSITVCSIEIHHGEFFETLVSTSFVKLLDMFGKTKSGEEKLHCLCCPSGNSSTFTNSIRSQVVLFFTVSSIFYVAEVYSSGHHGSVGRPLIAAFVPASPALVMASNNTLVEWSLIEAFEGIAWGEPPHLPGTTLCAHRVVHEWPLTKHWWP